MSRLVVLVPAHNEEESLGRTLSAVLNQERPADLVVVIPNGCTDNTAAVARTFPVEVLELPKLEHRKSEALNRAWLQFAQDADVVVCLDADTELPPNALADWEQELSADKGLAASSSKFTAQGTGFLGRCQKSEYAAWADTCLQRGSTRVVSGTGSALAGRVLLEVAELEASQGPWSYESAVEDFRLTYQMRKLGYSCHVSPTVRAYTDTMPNFKSLWAQRKKWSGGTVEDLLSFGVNRYTWRDWGVQLAGLVNVLVVLLTLGFTTLLASMAEITLVWWWLMLPILVAAVEVKKSFRIPHWSWSDVALAASLAPAVFYIGFRAALFVNSWAEILTEKITGKSTDRWAAQYAAEGVN